jgi:hypothetical protein
MERNLLIAIFFFSLLLKGYSQDKIITLKKDTLDCKIIKISHNAIFFDLISKGVKSSGKMPLDGVLNYTISGRASTEDQKKANTGSFERLRLGMNGGTGYLLGSTKNAVDDMVSLGLSRHQAQSYYNNIRLGLSANADLTFLINPNLGAGIKYKFYNTSSITEGFFDPQDGLNLFYSTYKEQIYVNFAGASFFYQQFIGSQKSFKLNSAYTLGLATYRNEAEYLNGYYLLTGKNVGIDTSFGLEYFIFRHFSVGTDLSFFYSIIRKMKISDGSSSTTVNLDKNNYENLSRLDLSIGMKLYIGEK